MKLYGAYCIHNINDSIYLIGELHDTPNREPCELDKVFKQWDVTECLTELSIMEFFTVSSSNTPITASAGVKSANVYPSNVRRMYPYYIIESILDIGVFVGPYARLGTRLHPDARNTIKQFEKRMFEAMDHRRTTVNLIMSMIDPSRELPKWYTDFLQRFTDIGFGIDNTSNLVHDELLKLDAQRREQLLAFAKKHIEECVQIDADIYSRAMESSTHLVSTKYDKVRSFFISLFGIIMDVYMLARMLNSTANHAVVCGFNHMQRLFAFFKDSGLITSGWTAFSNDPSYVDLSVDRRPLVNVQTS